MMSEPTPKTHEGEMHGHPDGHRFTKTTHGDRDPDPKELVPIARADAKDPSPEGYRPDDPAPDEEVDPENQTDG